MSKDRIHFTLEPVLVKKIDIFRREARLQSRSEVIRSLVQQGLEKQEAIVARRTLGEALVKLGSALASKKIYSPNLTPTIDEWLEGTESARKQFEEDLENLTPDEAKRLYDERVRAPRK